MSNRKLNRILIPVAVLAVGLVGAVMMARSRETPPRQERVNPGPLVEVVRVARADVAVPVVGNGEVVPKVAVDVVPQVAGKVVRTHPSLVAGGFFRAGEPLVVIDGRDYELAVERAQAAVARAEVALETQRAEADIARQEWDAIHPGEDPPSGLVVREPQVRQADAELAAAEADLDVARLNLRRTHVSVPFDGIVVAKSVDAGQFVAGGQRIARVYGTAAVEVRLPLKDADLSWIEVPRGGSGTGPEARIRSSAMSGQAAWSGRVVRQEAEVDPNSRMVHVVIEVQRPYDVTGKQPPLRPGSFVEVELEGVRLEDVVEVPRHAIHAADTVWVVEDGRLRVRSVVVARSDRKRVWVSSGLESGDSVVLSALDAVTDGMVVRIVGEEPVHRSEIPAAAPGGSQ